MDWQLTEKGFTVFTPQKYRPWYNYLSNGDYGIKLSHLADGYATTLHEPRIAVTNYDFFYPIKGRFVYIRDGEQVWNPSYWPAGKKLDEYSCTHEPGATSWNSRLNGIEVKETVFLPRKGEFEILTVEVTNNRKERADIRVFPEVEFLLYNSFGVDPVYYSWYSDTHTDDTNTIFFQKRSGTIITGFFAALEKPATIECSLKRFIGGGDPTQPEEVVNGELSGSMSAGDPYIGAFQYNLSLAPGEKKSLAFFSGIGEKQYKEIRETYKTWNDVENELAYIRKTWKEKLSLPAFSTQKEGSFHSWLNTFFGYQIYQQSTGLVRGTYRGFRDVAQDAMGIASYDKDIARNLLIDMCTRQFTNGRCLRQWNTEGGANDERDFRDLPFWIIAALSTYERLTGDGSIYTCKAKWLDSQTESTLWEHAVKGIEYALVYEKHGLIKIGVGDWNDALSGPGPDGGSVFLNQFAYWTLGLLQVAAAAHNLSHSFDIAGEQQKLYDGTMAYWNGSWFGRAVCADGTIIGKDDRIFMMPQVWFTLSGMAKRNPKIAETALNNMLKHLERPEGLLKVNPGYQTFDPTVGNISGLAPGMAENFAIYNHAAAFAVYALFEAGRKDDALRIMSKILPFTKDWKVTKAEPFVLVNFYNGGFRPDKAGEGGIPWLTGTVNWLAMSIFDFMVPQNLSL